MQRLDHIRLILADLDGTLLDDDKQLDPDIARVVNEKKLQLTFVTGRNRHIVTDFINDLGIQLPYIINNGAHIIQGDQCIYEQNIRKDELQLAISTLCSQHIAFLAYSNDAIYRYGRDSSLDRFIHRLIGKCAIYDGQLPEHCPIFKITVICEEEKKMLPVMNMINQKCSTAHLVPSEGNIYTLTHRDASKGNTVMRLLEVLKIQPSEVLAFGDNFNDMSMFAVIPHCVAMGNAPDVVKRQAAFTTYSNNEKGVSRFIEEHLK